MVVEGIVKDGFISLDVGREFADGTRLRVAVTSAEADRETELQILRDAYAEEGPDIEAGEFMKQWAEKSGITRTERR